MYLYHCMNPIAEVGLKKFDGNYAETDNLQNAEAVLIRLINKYAPILTGKHKKITF